MNKKIIIYLFIGLHAAAMSAEESKGNIMEFFDSKSPKEKTEITCSGPLEVDYQKNIITFNDNVLVKDVQLMMRAQKMRVFFDPKTKTVEKIIAEGDVRFKKDKQLAKSQKAVYSAKEGTVVLTGNPMVKREMDALSGEKITFYKEANKMVCEPSARLVVFTDEKQRENSEWW